jgi:hypothetical protein
MQIQVFKNGIFELDLQEIPVSPYDDGNIPWQEISETGTQLRQLTRISAFGGLYMIR